MVRRLVCITLLLGAPSCASLDEQIPPTLANQLAGAAEAVALSLEAGDACAAEAQAEQLLARVETALEDGSLPTGLGRELRRRAARLATTVECVVPEAPDFGADETPIEEDIEDEEDDDEGEGDDDEGDDEEDQDDDDED